MSSNAVTTAIDRQEWLEPVADKLAESVASAFQSGDTGRKAEDFLHGVWLGHPLHPVITDVPVGAWTVAAVLDLADAVGNTRVRGAGDAAVAVGLAGAVGAAVTGLTDWHRTDGKDRRVGLVHGLLNITATSLYAASWLLRRRGDRQTARLLAWTGYAIAGASAYLGGSLVYDRRIGVNHAPEPDRPDRFVPVLPAADLPDNAPRAVVVEGRRVMLVRQNDRIFALLATCAHLGGPLEAGELQPGSIQCPWHGSRFALEDGSVLNGPATYCQPCYDVRVRDGQIEIRVRHEEPAAELELPAGPELCHDQSPTAVTQDDLVSGTPMPSPL